MGNADFAVGLLVGFVSTCVVVIVAFLLCAAHEDAQDDAGETVDEWGKPDWVGKEQK